MLRKSGSWKCTEKMLSKNTDLEVNKIYKGLTNGDRKKMSLSLTKTFLDHFVQGFLEL